MKRQKTCQHSRNLIADGRASNALALAGDLPKDKKKLLRQLREAMVGHRPLRPVFMRGL